jgi:isochorismate synthase
VTDHSPPLVAVRFPLDPGPVVDSFALAGSSGILFHAPGRVLVGLGTAITLELPNGLDDIDQVRRVGGALSSVPCRDHFDRDAPRSHGVVGFGSLPFDRSEPASLVVPEVLYGREADGQEWITVVAPAEAALPVSAQGLRAWLLEHSAPVTPDTAQHVDHPRLEPRTTDAAFLSIVQEGLAAIGRGDVSKVVLARQVDAVMHTPVDLPSLLRRWQQLEPGCTIFSMPTPNGQFVGASPELLIERSGNRIDSQPLAGTAERFVGSEGSALPGELLESAKDAAEHGLVVEAIEASLRPLCTELNAPPQPALVRLRSIVHLGTPLSGTLRPRPDGSIPNALELVQVLHPTPAVGGVPAQAARAMIKQLEPEPRGHFAGPVGYLDAAGDGRWMLGIRAMTIESQTGRTARMAAGVGIVADSNPETELAETGVKLASVLEALDPPVLQVHEPVEHAAAMHQAAIQ